MHKLTAIASCMLFMTLPSVLSSQMLIGASGGINHTSLSGDAPPGTAYSVQLGFAAAAVVDIPLGDDIRLSLQPGYTHFGTGVAVTSALREPEDTLDVSMEYVVLPVLGRIVARNGITFATGGIQAAMLTGASSTPISGGKKTDISGAIADFDLAIIIGAGAQIPFSTSLATIELRYVQSLLNAGKTEEAAKPFQMPPRFRLSGLQLFAGILFSL